MQSLPILAALAAFAGSTATHPIDHCAKASTTVELNECGAKYLAESEANLNAIYRDVLAALAPTEESLLVKAQRTWLVFSEQSCSFEREHVAQDGSMGMQIYLGCMSGMADDRAKELSSYLERP